MLTQRRWKAVLIFFSLLLLIFVSTACTTKEETIANENQFESRVNQKDDPKGKQTEGELAEQSHGPGTFAPFWQVSHNGNLVYLLGSIHLAQPDLYPLHEKIESAFAESQYLAVEVDILNMDHMQMQVDVMKKARYSDGSKLKHHIPPYEYMKLKNRLKGHNIKIEMFESYEPWYISMLLDSLNYTKLKYDSQLGVDYHFLKQATGQKEIIELESAEFQIDLIDGFSEELQLAQLRGSLRSLDVLQQELESMFEVWKSGNDEELHAYLEQYWEDSEEYQELITEYNEAMLDNRNIGMTNKIESYLLGKEKGTYFVIVGAAHYVGDMGIVKLLVDRGYTVEKQDWTK